MLPAAPERAADAVSEALFHAWQTGALSSVLSFGALRLQDRGALTFRLPPHCVSESGIVFR